MLPIVFDMGGTLMNFCGMTDTWCEYYKCGFENIANDFNCSVSNETLENSVQILNSYNPRLVCREIEYSSQYIFRKALKDWNLSVNISNAVNSFWQGLKLSAEIYEDSVPTLKKLRAKGYPIAVLTDLPSAMPDEIFKNHIKALLKYVDCYISSQSCGYRKPNPHGLQLISDNTMYRLKS